MSAELEAFLARLYTDAALRARFLADRAGEAMRAGLPPSQRAALQVLDAEDLELAAASFAHKRRQRPPARRRRWWQRRG